MEKHVAHSPTRRRVRLAAAIIVGIAAAYGLIVGFVVPPIAKKVAADKLGEKIGRPVVIDDVSVNPYTLVATVKGFRILEADGKTVFTSIDRIDVDGSITSAYRLAPVADEVTVAGLKVNLVRDGDTHYNVSDIIGRLAAEQAKTPPSTKKPEFSLSNIRLTNARIDFDDRPKGAKHQVSDINVAIPFISSLPGHLKEYVEPRFWAKVNGTPLRVKGETLPFENSLRTHINLDLDAFDVHRYVEYSPSPLPVKVDDGKLDARISVRFTQSAGKDPSVDIAGKVALRGLKLSTPDGGSLAQVGEIDADVASFDPLGGLAKVDSIRVRDVSAAENQWIIPAVEVKAIAADLHKKDVRIESIATNGGTMALKRQADGSIELPLKIEKSGSVPDSEPWVLSLGKLAVDSYKVSVTDQSVKPAALHRVGITHLEANDFSTRKGSKTAVNVNLALDKGGTVEVVSTLGIDPLQVDAKIDVRRVDLVTLRPYAEHFQTVKLKSANASAKGTLTVVGEGNAMRVAYSGSADVSNVATWDSTSKEDLVNWNHVKLTGIAFRWSRNDPLQVHVAEVGVDKAYARVVVTPEGQINLQQLKFATEDNPAPAPETEEKARDIRIDKIVVAGSRLNFTDHFIKPNYTADVGDLHGTVTELSSDPQTRGVVDLEGSWDQSSPVLIGGRINPLSGNLYVDISAKGSDIELPKLSAYSARYAGYGITQGKLTLDVKYHVEDGKLQGRNNIHLDQLVFGDKVEGPDATTLPVLFAVNLLKDSKGAINLELPISGSLEDPQFEIGALVAQVVKTLLKRALTNPFSLLTAAFGGSGGSGNGAVASGAATPGDDLAYVDFDPGRGEIGAAGQKKLDTVAKALLDRPAIKLEMAGRVDPDKDLAALKQAMLERKLKDAKRAALKTAGKPVPEQVTIEEAEYPGLMKAMLERQKVAVPKEATRADLEALVLATFEVPQEELQALATRRAEQVKDYLVGKGQLPADRIVLAAAGQPAAEASAPATRVVFTLK